MGRNRAPWGPFKLSCPSQPSVAAGEACQLQQGTPPKGWRGSWLLVLAVPPSCGQALSHLSAECSHLCVAKAAATLQMPNSWSWGSMEQGSMKCLGQPQLEAKMSAARLNCVGGIQACVRRVTTFHGCSETWALPSSLVGVRKE